MAELIRRNPFAELQALQRQFFGDDWAAPVRSANIPTTDVYTRDGELVVEAHLPHFEREDIAVDVEDNALKISAKRNEREEDKDKSYVVRESAMSFNRSVSLPENVDTDKIQAELKNGVLKVTVPVPEAKSSKKTIEIIAKDDEK